MLFHNLTTILATKFREYIKKARIYWALGDVVAEEEGLPTPIHNGRNARKCWIFEHFETI